jgi:hypothetical protein
MREPQSLESVFHADPRIIKINKGKTLKDSKADPYSILH